MGDFYESLKAGGLLEPGAISDEVLSGGPTLGSNLNMDNAGFLSVLSCVVNAMNIAWHTELTISGKQVTLSDELKRLCTKW